MTISANIIVYNEEKNIDRCLTSLDGIANEIIVVHDGKCSDKTLDIAKKYTKKIFVRIGEAEPHRQFALDKATSDWILILDADEYLSADNRKSIPSLAKNASADGFTLNWTFYDKGKKITTGPFSNLKRLALFRRSKVTGPKKFHEWYKVDGKIEHANVTIEHMVPVDNWQLSGFKRKNWPRAKYDARHRIISGYAKWPFFIYLPLAISLMAVLFPYSYIYKRLIFSGSLGFRIAFLTALYSFLIYFYIFTFKLTRKLPKFS